MAREDRPTIDGRVERVVDGVVEGWAWDPGAPQDRVTLRVRLDEREVGATIAQLERPSLTAAGIGDGGHAFRFMLPPSLAGGGIHTLRVEAADESALPPAGGFAVSSDEGSRWQDTEFMVDVASAPGGPGTATASRPDAAPPAPAETPPPAVAPATVPSPPPPPPPAAGGAGGAGGAVSIEAAPTVVDGRVERVGGGVLHGWAWHPDAPGQRVRLRVLADDHELGETVAALPRPSLVAAGIGDGEHAFQFALPLALADGGVHVLRVETQDGRALQRAEGFAGGPGDAGPWQGTTFTVIDDRVPEVLEPPRLPQLVGRGGWLFDPAAAGSWGADDAVAATAAAVSELSAALGVLARGAAGRTVRVVVALSPPKEHVYRRQLPLDVGDRLPQRPGDLLVGAMLRDPSLDPLDLMTALRDGAESHAVFEAASPELSDWGAFCAYRAIVKRIAGVLPGVEAPIDLGAPEVREASTPRWPGPAIVATDVGLLNCRAEELPDPPPRPVLVVPDALTEPLPEPESAPELAAGFIAGWERPASGELAGALFVGGAALRPIVAWAATHFHRTWLIDVPPASVAAGSRLGPDVIVCLIDERALLTGAAAQT